MNRILFYLLLAIIAGLSVAGIIVSAQNDDATLSAGLWGGAVLASILLIHRKYLNRFGLWVLSPQHPFDIYIGLYLVAWALLIAGITLSSVKHASDDGPSVATISGVWGGCDLAFIAYFMLHWFGAEY